MAQERVVEERVTTYTSVGRLGGPFTPWKPGDRPLVVFPYCGWNVVCRRCRVGICTSTGHYDHGTQAAGMDAAYAHLRRVHDLGEIEV
jgi:hypothetical protein